MKKLLDLRFVIGSFFFIVGLMLLIYSFMSKESDVNRWCGIVFSLFGVVMIAVSFRRDAEDEL